MDLDLVITNGVVVTASDTLHNVEIGIADGVIRVLGVDLPRSKATRVVDAQGGFITPGGVDSHVHLAQYNAGDGFESGTRSAVCGGTTTVLSFAPQMRSDESLKPVVAAYHAKADGVAYCDYGFHMILTNPSEYILQNEMSWLATEAGITSVKLYMTYEPLRVTDRQILDIMHAMRSLGMTTMIHAENSDMIALVTESLEARGLTEPYYHAVSRPALAETEATYRAVCLSELMDAPILLVHVSSKRACEHILAAQTRLLPVHAETCPHYMYLLAEKLREPHFHGAKHVCSPPLRESPEEAEAIWAGVANGTFTTVSSDHAARKYDHPEGKLAGLVDGRPMFRKIPNGLPGLEVRVPLMMKGVEEGRLTMNRFVELTSSNPAKLYGLTRKGTIAPGYDADLVIWYGKGEMKPFVLNNDMLHDDMDYTPFEGITFANWPRLVFVRGQLVYDHSGPGLVESTKGIGKYIPRERAGLRQPRNVFVNEWRP